MSKYLDLVWTIRPHAEVSSYFSTSDLYQLLERAGGVTWPILRPLTDHVSLTRRLVHAAAGASALWHAERETTP